MSKLLLDDKTDLRVDLLSGRPWESMLFIEGTKQHPFAHADTWSEKAACRGTDPDTYYDDDLISTLAAKAVCAQCPIQRECLSFAMGNGEQYGIWGGLTPPERRKLRQSQARALAKATAPETEGRAGARKNLRIAELLGLDRSSGSQQKPAKTRRR